MKPKSIKRLPIDKIESVDIGHDKITITDVNGGTMTIKPAPGCHKAYREAAQALQAKMENAEVEHG